MNRESLRPDARRYLSEVDRLLASLPADYRDEIAVSLEADIDDPDIDYESLVRRFGTPAALAHSAFEEYQSQSGRDARPRWATPSRMVALGALLAAVLGVAAFLLLPVYIGVEYGVGPPDVRARYALEVEGPRALVAGLIPIAVSAVPLVVGARRLTLALGACAILLSALVVIGGASIGLFLGPAAVLEWVAFALSFRGTRS